VESVAHQHARGTRSTVLRFIRWPVLFTVEPRRGHILVVSADRRVPVHGVLVAADPNVQEIAGRDVVHRRA